MTRQPIAVAGLAVAVLGLGVAVTLDTPGSAWEWTLVGAAAALVAWLFTLRLRIEVTRRAVLVSMGPLRRTIPVRDIASVEVTTYHPIRQFGGWGWRFGRGGSRQYAMTGDEAVRLTLADGREVFIGSGDENGLATAIRSVAGS